ncbi:Uncharacterised protein [Sphingobacterium daejeonense]|nr:Uncharacterised protein [Sphingobacterium daejeonense]
MEKMRDTYSEIISSPQLSNEDRPIVEPEPTFTDWLMKHKNRNSPLGDLASKRGFSDGDERWPLYSILEDYRDYLRDKKPTSGCNEEL